ncbi:hypothetical protein [Parafrankia elaeagni]|uniref:hypothetical protein n=1 Tax=Parafrankia elaeagni TaxID=222534 RepID=UPI00036F96CD|nr:hypothetical protein [Parafrankia elaeagni]
MAGIEDPKKFADTYLLMFNKLWANESEIARLRSNPRQYALDAGLPVEAGREVRIDETAMDGLYTTERLVQDWTGTEGVHVLHAPPAPTFDPAELTDVELDTVAAGAAAVVIIACYVDTK